MFCLGGYKGLVMTIKEFAVKCGVLESTVKDWIEKGYIPGSQSDSIPSSARPPYTATRAKTGSAIIRSMLKACNNHYGIFAGIYNLSQDAFDAYVKSLLDGGYIVEYKEEGVTYYNITVKGVQFLLSWSKAEVASVLKFFSSIIGLA